MKKLAIALISMCLLALGSKISFAEAKYGEGSWGGAGSSTSYSSIIDPTSFKVRPISTMEYSSGTGGEAHGPKAVETPGNIYVSSFEDLASFFEPTRSQINEDMDSALSKPDGSFNLRDHDE